MNDKDPLKTLDQRAREAAVAMEQLTARMAEVQAEAEAIHAESEALLKAAEEAAEAALRANYRKSGRIRFHLGQNRSMYIKTYTPGLSKSDKNLVYVGILQRSCFKNEDLWESTLEKLNGFMEHIFQLGVDYQRDVIAQGLDPGTGRSSKTNTPKKVQPTSKASTPVSTPVPVVKRERGNRKRSDLKDDAISRLFRTLSVPDRAIITAFYSPSGITAESLLERYKGKSIKIAQMAFSNRMRQIFNSAADREFKVAHAVDVLRIASEKGYRQDLNKRYGQVEANGNG